MNVSTIEPYTPAKSSDDKYEFVDVAQKHGEASKIETGQTARFFTSGEVNERFWLEHLGEDFKNAIHLQVGGEDRTGVFNMSENGSAYKVQDESINKPVLQHEVNAPTTNDKTTEEKSKKKAKADGIKKSRKIRQKQKPEPQIENSATIFEPTKNDTDTNTKQEQTESDITSKQSFSGTDQWINGVAEKNDYKEDLKKYKKCQHINLKYAPEYNKTAVKNRQYPNDTSIMNQTLEEIPVVVNLPESNKMIELESSDSPVVVRMPPVIYHREPINITYPENYTDNTQNIQTQTSQLQEEQALVGEQTKSVNTQYTQHPYSTMTYEQQQHYQQFEPYSPNTNFAQTQQHTQYPLQTRGSQYPTQYQQTTPYNQQQHPQQQYSSQTSYSTPNYYNVYPPDIGSIPIQQPNGLLQANNMVKSRYMYSKRSIPSYGEYSMQQTQPTTIYQYYNRGRPTNGELYQEGV